MTAEDRDLITAGFKNINEKIDLVIHPIKEDVTEIKSTVGIHTDKINTLELFKEGHQTFHSTASENAKEKKESKRFYWEILVGSGFIGILIIYFMGG